MWVLSRACPQPLWVQRRLECSAGRQSSRQVRWHQSSPRVQSWQSLRRSPALVVGSGQHAGVALLGRGQGELRREAVVHCVLWQG